MYFGRDRGSESFREDRKHIALYVLSIFVKTFIPPALLRPKYIPSRETCTKYAAFICFSYVFFSYP